ncbi:MAG: M20/M25/M40 family metallo-hydrolase, partial [Deltaproteobacteria bacterium]|nr:M20/M25/M40 family metallo-hydrolase [Deltaproteobacteria bacterium]
MTMMDTIRGITANPQRGACTESERAASAFVYDVMEKEGFAPRFHDFTVHPDFHVAYALHFVLAIAFALVARCCPVLSIAGLVFVMLSFYGDATLRWYWLRRLTRKGSSRHVIGRVGPETAKRTIILSGHHDAGQTSKWIFEPTKLKAQQRFWKQKLGTPMPQYLLIVGGMGLLLLSAVLRALGHACVFTRGFEIAGVIVCAIAAFGHMTMYKKGFGGGASDNASGVASVIEIARRLRDNLPPDTKLVLVSFGAEETMVMGSGTTVKRLFAGENREHTYAINLDGVGGGDIRYCLGEGLLGVYAFDPELVAAAKYVARKPGFERF